MSIELPVIDIEICDMHIIPQCLWLLFGHSIKKLLMTGFEYKCQSRAGILLAESSKKNLS